MKLRKFRVMNFRSIDDTGWIDADDVTALIGTNEAGKTNVLLPLWKFNPAKEGPIVPTADYPRKHFNSFRHQNPKPVFVSTVFELGDELASKVGAATNMPVDKVRTVEVSKDFDGVFSIDFPDAEPPRAIARERVLGILEGAHREIIGMGAMRSEEELKRLIVASLKNAIEALPASDLEQDALDSALASCRDQVPHAAGVQLEALAFTWL